MKKIREYLEEHGTAIRKFSGLAVSVLTVLALVGCLSYLFTWKQDQSLLAAQEVAESANLAGKAGMSLSALLVGRWFGLGAFAVVFAMIILSVRLLFGKRKFPVVKNIVLSITGAVLLSFSSRSFPSASVWKMCWAGDLAENVAPSQLPGWKTW